MVFRLIRSGSERDFLRTIDLLKGDRLRVGGGFRRLILLICISLFFIGNLSGCLKKKQPSTAEPLAAPSPTHTQAAILTQTESSQPGSPAQTAYPGPIGGNPGVTSQPGGAGASPYPGPGSTAAATPTSPAFLNPPGSSTPTVNPGPYPGPARSATPPPFATLPAGGSQTTPAASAVASTPTPTSTGSEFFLRPVLPPPQNQFALVTIWHALDEIQANYLMTAIRAFQDQMPNVRFNVLSVPQEDLRARYESAAYQGEGPSLLIGPSEWGPNFYDEQLVEDLSPFLSTALLQVIFAPAFSNGEYRQAVISLPYAMSGVVMYRNRQIIAEAPQTFAELSAAAQQVTHGGLVGSYLERGFYYSGAHLEGIGGQWSDAEGNPLFNQDDYKKALEWVSLLQSFNQIGPTNFNDNHDLDLFEQGKAGIIIDGTWNREILAAAIGEQNLSIDPWPAYDGGQLAGYVKTDSLYLNANTGFISADDQFAALQFMGYLLAPEVQKLFSESGMIPVVKNVVPDDPLIQQSMQALSGGVAFPVGLPDEVRRAYWDTLDAAIYRIFEGLDTPIAALQSAYEQISTRLAEIRQEP